MGGLRRAFDRFRRDFNNQADRANDTAERAANDVDQQLTQANDTAERAANDVDEQLTRANDTAERAANDVDEQLTRANDTAERAVDLGNQHATDVKHQIEIAVKEFGETNEVVRDAIELFKPSIAIFLAILGPMQLAGALYYTVLVLKTLGLTPSVQPSIRELGDLNNHLRAIGENFLEAETLDIVRAWTRGINSSVILDKSDGKLTAYFFYTSNNSIQRQLSMNGYFAYDSLSELWRAVYIWNSLYHEAHQNNPLDHPDTEAQRQTQEFLRRRHYEGSPEEYLKDFNVDNLEQFDQRKTKIFLIDPSPTEVTLPPLEFAEILKDVEVINHSRATDLIRIESVRVHAGCSVKFDYFTVCAVDREHHGNATFKKCKIGWKLPLNAVDEKHGIFKCKIGWEMTLMGMLFSKKIDDDTVQLDGLLNYQECSEIQFPNTKKNHLKKFAAVAFVAMAVAVAVFMLYGDEKYTTTPRAAPNTTAPGAVSINSQIEAAVDGESCTDNSECQNGCCTSYFDENAFDIFFYCMTYEGDFHSVLCTGAGGNKRRLRIGK